MAMVQKVNGANIVNIYLLGDMQEPITNVVYDKIQMALLQTKE